MNFFIFRNLIHLTLKSRKFHIFDFSSIWCKVPISICFYYLSIQIYQYNRWWHWYVICSWLVYPLAEWSIAHPVLFVTNKSHQNNYSKKVRKNCCFFGGSTSGAGDDPWHIQFGWLQNRTNCVRNDSSKKVRKNDFHGGFTRDQVLEPQWMELELPISFQQ